MSAAAHHPRGAGEGADQPGRALAADLRHQAVRARGLWRWLRSAGRALAVCALLCLAPADSLADKKSARQLLISFIDDVRTYQADFKQTLLDRNGEPIESWTGRFWMRRPGKFRWRYTSPYVQEIIGDGERIYQYDEDLKQLIVDFQNDLLATAPTRFLFDKPALSQFNIHDIGTLDGMRLIQLQDKRRDTAYEEFLIAFRKGIIETIEMRDSFDQVTRINYSKVRINRRIKSRDLRLPELADDVDVLDRTAPKPTAPDAPAPPEASP